MPAILDLIARFRAIDDVETTHAFFRTRVGTVGPQAYLNIVFKPAETALRDEIKRELSLSRDTVEFLAVWNGARLYFDDLTIYGCVPPRSSRRRTDPFAIQPFCIRDANIEFKDVLDAQDLVCIGSYGYDRSLVCMERSRQSIICAVGDDLRTVRTRWGSLHEWLTSEISRLSVLFDEQGNRLAGESAALPTSRRSAH